MKRYNTIAVFPIIFLLLIFLSSCAISPGSPEQPPSTAGKKFFQARKDATSTESESAALVKQLESAAKNTAGKILGALHLSPERDGSYLGSIILEDKEWEKGSWNRLSHNFYDSVTREIGVQAPWISIIVPFTTYREFSAQTQYGRYISICGEYRLPEYRIYLSSRMEDSSLFVDVDCRKVGSPVQINGFPLKETVDLSFLKSKAESWYLSTEKAPSYAGSEEDPFTTETDAAAFLAKVLCCSIPGIKHKYGLGIRRPIIVKIGKFTATGEATHFLSSNFLAFFTNKFTNKLSQFCPGTGQIETTEDLGRFIKNLQIFQSEKYRAKSGIAGPRLRAPAILVTGILEEVERKQDVIRVCVSAVWLLNRHQGLKVNELSAEACFHKNIPSVAVRLHPVGGGYYNIEVMSRRGMLKSKVKGFRIREGKTLIFPNPYCIRNGSNYKILNEAAELDFSNTPSIFLGSETSQFKFFFRGSGTIEVSFFLDNQRYKLRYKYPPK